MRRLAQVILVVLLAWLVASCSSPGQPTAAPTSDTIATRALNTSTWTPVPTSPTPTATSRPSPTATPSSTPTPTATPTGMGWHRFPNMLDLCGALAADDALWLASLGGLARVDWLDGSWELSTEADGLADNVLLSLADDGRWLWIGTSQGGVSRFDRTTGEWRTYTTDEGLSSNRNVLVHYDGETLWAGTLNGLSWYDSQLDGWQSLFTAASVELAGVTSLAGDIASLWVSIAPRAEAPGALLRLDKGTDEWEVISGSPGGPSSNSYYLAQSEELLWAIPPEGLPWEFDRQTAGWRQLSEIAPDGVAPGDGFDGAQHYAGALWLYARHRGELVRYDPESRRASHYPAAPLASLGLQGQIVGHDDVLLFTGKQGLLTFNLVSGEWRSLRQSLRAVYRIMGERSGQLLVDTDQGPGLWAPELQSWQLLAPEGTAEQILPGDAALERDGPGVWLTERSIGGTDTEGPPHLLYFLEPGAEAQRFELAPPAGWTIYQLLPRSIGNTLWFAGNRGFLSYNPAVDQWGVFEVAGDSLSILHVQLLESVVWFVTQSDLGQFDTNTGVITLTPLPSAPVSGAALAIAPNATWLLADRALYWRAPDDGDWTMVNSTAPCLEDATRLVYWSGAVWLGGAHGVGRVEPPASAWHCLGPADGMTDAEFAQILPLGDTLWFSHPWYGVWFYRES